ncbi:MAG: SgcJ/EcaC family oxidoreductase [Gemmatimonadetes bacterium]|nr:SgcJ/EcaC family oxidoreductase [Gemmatimonadota bacterium]
MQLSCWPGFSCAREQRSAGPGDEQAIRELYDRYEAAVEARDVDAVMALYVPGESLVAFDAFPPRQYQGAAAYRKAYEGFFAAFPGPLTDSVIEMRITASDSLAFAHGVDRWVVTGSDGKPVEMVLRWTNGLRKVDGKWLIAHEHVSVPVDPATGQADFLSNP